MIFFPEGPAPQTPLGSLRSGLRMAELVGLSHILSIVHEIFVVDLTVGNIDLFFVDGSKAGINVVEAPWERDFKDHIPWQTAPLCMFLGGLPSARPPCFIAQGWTANATNALVAESPKGETPQEIHEDCRLY
jgi:hypothetical protein